MVAVAGLFANAGPIPYSASKAAVRSMAQTASYELTGQNVRVNAICPGLIQVSLYLSLLPDCLAFCTHHLQTDMTKLMFEIAKMTGKESKMGALNPLMRQGLGSGTLGFSASAYMTTDGRQRSLRLHCSWHLVSGSKRQAGMACVLSIADVYKMIRRTSMVNR